jgi:hypothetical protein
LYVSEDEACGRRITTDGLQVQARYECGIETLAKFEQNVGIYDEYQVLELQR